MKNVVLCTIYLYLWKNPFKKLALSCTYLLFYSLKNKYFKHWKFSFVFRKFLNLKKGSDNDGGFREKKIFDNLTLICFAEKCKTRNKNSDISGKARFFFYNISLFSSNRMRKISRFSAKKCLRKMRNFHETISSFRWKPYIRLV